MTATANLPEHQSKSIDINLRQSHQTVVQIDRAFQHLGSHVA